MGTVDTLEKEVRLPRYWEMYDARLCFELALGLSPLAEILERYNLTPAELQKLVALPAFKHQVLAYKREIKEKGLSFREKAKIMAEDLLGTAYDLINHVHTPASEKVKLIAWVSKMAGHEPTATQQDNSTNFLPAIQERLKAIPDEDLEIQVTRIVQRRKERERTIEGETLPVTLQ